MDITHNLTLSDGTPAVGNLTIITPTHDVWDFDDEAVTSWDTNTTAGTEAALESAIQTAMGLGTTASPQYHRIAWTGGAISSDWVLTVSASLPDKYGPHILIDGFNGGSTYTDFNAELEFGTGISNVKFVGFKFRHASNWSSQAFAQPMVRFYNGDNGGRRFSFARNRFGDFWDGNGRNVFSRAFQTGTGAYNIECSIKNNEARDLFEFLEIGVGKWDVRHNLVTGLVDDFASCYGRGNGGEMYLYALGNAVVDMHDAASDSAWHCDFIQCADNNDIASDSYRVEAQGNLYIGNGYQQYPTMAAIIQAQGSANTFRMTFEDNIFLCTGTRGFWLPDRRCSLHRNMHAWPPLGGAVPTSGTGWNGGPFNQYLNTEGTFGTDPDIDVGTYWASQNATNDQSWGSWPNPAQLIEHQASLGGATSYDTRFPNMTGLSFSGSTLIIDNGFSSVSRTIEALRTWVSDTYEPNTVANGTGWAANGFNDPANWFAGGESSPGAPITSGQHAITFDWDSETRDVIIDVPNNYDPNTAYGCVFVLHGQNAAASGMALTNVADYGEANKYLTVYPSSLGANWNLGYPFFADDVGFIRAFIDELVLNWNVDRDKVFCTGHSQGGHMTMYLAAEDYDLFQGYGVVCVGVNDRVDHVTGGLGGGIKPFFFHHYEQDPLNPYNGNGTIQGAQYTIDFWNTENNASNTMSAYSTISGDTDGFDVDLATSSDGNIVSTVVRDAVSHGWGPDYGKLTWSDTEADYAVSSEMIDFFKTKGL